MIQRQVKQSVTQRRQPIRKPRSALTRVATLGAPCTPHSKDGAQPARALGETERLHKAADGYKFPLARSVLGRFSRSQNHEDLALYEMFFTKRRGGTFVEIGAPDGFEYSNSSLLSVPSAGAEF